MKRTLLISILLLSALIAFSDDTLTLTWDQPPGFSSTLFTSTNLNGCWTSLGTVNPPYITQETNRVAFFYVSVAPTNIVNVPVLYTNGTPGVPQYPASPCIAYDPNGILPLMVWRVSDRTWN